MRRATVEDAASLASLHQHVHSIHVDTEPEVYRSVSETDMRGWFERQLGADDTRLVIAGDAEALGYVHFQLRRLPETRLTAARTIVLVHQMGVRPDARRRGLGRRLIDAVAAFAEEEGADEVELQVRAANPGAIAFYEDLGFFPRSHRLALPPRMPGRDSKQD